MHQDAQKGNTKKNSQGHKINHKSIRSMTHTKKTYKQMFQFHNAEICSTRHLSWSTKPYDQLPQVRSLALARKQLDLLGLGRNNRAPPGSLSLSLGTTSPAAEAETTSTGSGVQVRRKDSTKSMIFPAYREAGAALPGDLVFLDLLLHLHQILSE